MGQEEENGQNVPGKLNKGASLVQVKNHSHEL